MGATLLLPVAAGMISAQIIATCFVYLSDQSVLRFVRSAEQAGWFPLPAGPAQPSLSSFAAAFWGGLFYTLSIGAGLALLTWAAFQLWRLLFRRNRFVLIAYAVLWTGLLVFVNAKGLVLFPSLFCLLVPLATVIACIQAKPPYQHHSSFVWVIPVLTLVMLTGLWTTQLNRNLFTTIRDHILLSNPAGRRVNDFYYRYTLYAAESFKSFFQKSLRSASLEQTESQAIFQNWKARLAHYDVLVLSHISRPDIRFVFSKEGIRLIAADGRGIGTTAKEFLADPNRVLRSFSKATDRFAPLRRLTLAGLLLGFPVLLFAMVYGLLSSAARLVIKPANATWAASVICMVIGVWLFLPMLNARPVKITPDTINTALSADQWTHRVAALRYIAENNLDIATFPSYRRLAGSGLVVERYWLARAMAKSRTDETYSLLLAMINDPHPNVICQAFYALGERGQPTAIDPIKRRIVQLDHWYAQWYGYGALRKLGWRQTTSN